MNDFEYPPVFCDNCSTLALAKLENAPLCEECLIKSVMSAQQDDITEKITPLFFGSAPSAINHQNGSDHLALDDSA